MNAIGTAGGHDYLVTHAGLTEGYWRHFVGEPAPFDQIHGHSSTVDWATGREYGRPELSGLISEDPVRRHATAIVEGRRIIGIDPGHGRRPAKTWAPLVLAGAYVQ